MSPRRLTSLLWCLSGLAACFGMWYALVNAWVCDDAFISFRYVENFNNGLGLVYNAGERVEGYTNFLWVILLAAAGRAGVEPITASQYLGLLFFLLTIGLLMRFSWRTKTLPIAATGLALHGHSAIFSTCGLETSMFTFLVTASLVALIGAGRRLQFAAAGTLLILATMTRPDGAVFYAGAGIVPLLLAVRHRRRDALVAFAAPFVLLYLPYFAWKLGYYGYPFPNTFYAKSASRPYLGQGLYYLWLYFSCYWYLVPGLLVPAWLLLRRTGPLTEAGPDTRRGALAVALFTLPFLAYVVWVGGDFMFARFCLPATPALLLGLQLLARGRRGLAAAALLVLAGPFLTIYSIYTKAKIAPGNPRNVVEEKDHYPRWYVDAYRILGETLRRRCAGVDLRIAVGGAQAMLGYFGRFPYVLEVNGLTDTHIAHRELAARGRLGHEKRLPFDDPYFAERKVHLTVGVYQPVVVPNDRIGELRKFEFSVENVPFYPDGKAHTGFALATILTWDSAVMERLAGRQGLRFAWFPDHLDRYIAGLAQRQKEDVRKDLAAFRRFYFDHNEDPARLRAIEAFVE